MYKKLLHGATSVSRRRLGVTRPSTRVKCGPNDFSLYTRIASRSLRTKANTDSVQIPWGITRKPNDLASSNIEESTRPASNSYPIDEQSLFDEVAGDFNQRFPGLYNFTLHSNRSSILFDRDQPLDSQSINDVGTVTQRLEAWFKALNAVRHSRRLRLMALQLTQNVYLHPLVLDHRGIAIGVQWNHSSKANCLNSPILTQLTSVFNALSSFSIVHGVELTSMISGFKDQSTARTGAWCAGADVGELAGLSTGSGAAAYIQQISDLGTAIRTLPAVVIANIDGACIGAGLEVAASCDIRVSSENATFSMPEVNIGIPSVAEARMLCEIIGMGRARHLLLTGETWTASEAYAAGLITKLFSNNKKERQEWVHSFFAKCVAMNGVHKVQKDLFGRWEELGIEEGIKESLDVFADRYEKDGSFVRSNINDVVRRRKAAKERDNESPITEQKLKSPKKSIRRR